jgi:hypothetical protein
MNRTLFGVTLVVVVLLGSYPALGSKISRNAGPSFEIDEAKLPTGVHDLGARPNCVRLEHSGVGGSGPSYHYYRLAFQGDTCSLNDFLLDYERLADPELKSLPRKLVLHPGRSYVDALRKDKGVADWEFRLTSMEPSVDRSLPQIGPSWIPPKTEWTSIRVDLWLGGQVDLAKVKVPSNVVVESSGEIEKFVAAHPGGQSKARGALPVANSAPIMDAKDWRNPFITVERDGVYMSSLRRTIKVEQLRQTLLSLPKSAWPDGQTVALADTGLRSGGDDVKIARVHVQVLAILRELGLSVDLWPNS